MTFKKINTYFFKFLISILIVLNLQTTFCMKDLVHTALGDDTSFLKKACLGIAGYSLITEGGKYAYSFIVENYFINRGSIENFEKAKETEQYRSNKTPGAIALEESVDALKLTQADKKRIHFTLIKTTPETILSYHSYQNTIVMPDKNILEAEVSKFLTTHELTHAQKQDAKWRTIFKILFPPLFYLGIHSTMNIIDHSIKNVAENSNSTLLKNGYPLLSNYILRNGITHGLIYMTTAPFFINSFMQYQEKRADLNAAHALKSAKGGIMFMKIYQEAEQTNPDSMLTKAKNYLLCKNEHPSPTERIRYLEHLQKEEQLN